MRNSPSDSIKNEYPSCTKKIIYFLSAFLLDFLGKEAMISLNFRKKIITGKLSQQWQKQGKNNLHSPCNFWKPGTGTRNKPNIMKCHSIECKDNEMKDENIK